MLTTVSGQWSGVIRDIDCGVTDGDGQISPQANNVKSALSDAMFTFNLSNVDLSGCNYHSPAKLEMSVSIEVPQ